MSNFPCAADLSFLESQRRPAWATRLKTYATRTPIELIDSCVNAHAQRRYSPGELAAHNLLVIVAGYRRRGENILALLERISANPECAIDPKKRAAFARKWSRRIEVCS